MTFDVPRSLFILFIYQSLCESYSRALCEESPQASGRSEIGGKDRHAHQERWMDAPGVTQEYRRPAS